MMYLTLLLLLLASIISGFFWTKIGTNGTNNVFNHSYYTEEKSKKLFILTVSIVSSTGLVLSKILLQKNYIVYDEVFFKGVSPLMAIEFSYRNIIIILGLIIINYTIKYSIVLCAYPHRPFSLKTILCKILRIFSITFLLSYITPYYYIVLAFSLLEVFFVISIDSLYLFNVQFNVTPNNSAAASSNPIESSNTTADTIGITSSSTHTVGIVPNSVHPTSSSSRPWVETTTTASIDDSPLLSDKERLVRLRERKSECHQTWIKANRKAKSTGSKNDLEIAEQLGRILDAYEQATIDLNNHIKRSS